MSHMEFDNQSCSDLEFDLIRMMLHDYCIGPTAQLRMSELEPSADKKAVMLELYKTKEFVDIRREGQGFPAIDFDELDKEIRTLNMKGSALEAESFLKIRRDSELVNVIVSFLKTNRERFENLFQLCSNVKVTKDLLNAIDKVFDPKGRIKDEASPALKEIRNSIAGLRRQISRNFNKELKRLGDSGLLGETREAFVNDRRVLTVMSSSKRQVQGSVLGSSKTGSLTYIEPQINVPLNFELEMLFDDERNEIRKILQELTDDIREHIDLVRAYHILLTELDFIQAKSRLAIDLDANLPEISSEQIIELHKAYHPILLLSNRREGFKTLPQSLVMDKFSRMLVISGPNAGGKSITLKMVGLIQVMFQSGLLVPVEPHSKLGFFHAVLTDIGDHQSIENQLSTYSYRLKRMKGFLDIANRRSLLLLDEFGTGSDPELGGALAEVFFEELYNKKAFGVITTHYSNIKLKAADLRNAVNGCMLFDRESLEPLYQLSVGQPGSSFTFEVAEINGIPKELIEEAKTRLDDRKVQLDKMISELQKEKAQVEKINKARLDAERLALKAHEESEKKSKKLDEKLQQYNELQERNNLALNRGKKMQSFIDALGGKAKVKEVFDDVKKYISVERAKIDDAKKQEKLKQKVAAKKKGNQVPKPKNGQENIKVGSTVRLQNSKQIGTVIELDGKKAVVAFGVFKTNIDISKIVFVK
jgi:DNA mismatch repair protein MutS2